MISINENTVTIENNRIELPYPIKSVKEMENKYILLLKIPTRITLGEEELCNVLCYRVDGKFMWRIDKILPSFIESSDRVPYIAIDVFEQSLKATDFMGRRFEIDTENGKLLNVEIVK